MNISTNNIEFSLNSRLPSYSDLKTDPTDSLHTEKEDPFPYLTLNMDYTLSAWNETTGSPFVKKIRAISQVILFPYLMIAAAEAIFKNGLFLFLNLGIALANRTYQILSYEPQASFYEEEVYQKSNWKTIAFNAFEAVNEYLFQRKIG